MRTQDKRRLFSLFSLSINRSEYRNITFNRVSTADVTSKNSPYSFSPHRWLLAIIMMIVWGFTYFYYYIEIVTNDLMDVIIPALLYVLLSFLFTGYIRFNSLEQMKVWRHIWEKRSAICCKIPLILASPSWAVAKFYKSCITNKMGSKTEATKIEKTLFIAYKNMFNMLVSLLFAIPILIIDLNDFWTVFLMSIVVLRTLSRSFEITIAFGQDALDKEKSSLLTSPQRLMLAFTSLFECILNYTIAYYLVGYSVGEPICKWQAFVHSFQSALFFSNELLSNSLTSYKPTTLAMLQVTQAITCMTLVFIAFVIYISKTTEDKNTTTRRV